MSMREFLENFSDWGEEFIKPFKTFIQNNYDNPLLMFSILGISAVLFIFTYNTLNKDNQ